MRAGEAFAGGPNPTTLITSSSSQFSITGGKYWFAVSGNFSSGTATLQKVGPDGGLVSMATGLTQAGNNTLDLPPGTYQVTISGSTTASISWEVVRINEE